MLVYVLLLGLCDRVKSIGFVRMRMRPRSVESRHGKALREMLDVGLLFFLSLSFPSSAIMPTVPVFPFPLPSFLPSRRSLPRKTFAHTSHTHTHTYTYTHTHTLTSPSYYFFLVSLTSLYTCFLDFLAQYDG